MTVLEQVRRDLCSSANSLRSEAVDIVLAVGDRLLNADESVRKKAVDVFCDVSCQEDASLLVRGHTSERFVEMFNVYLSKSLEEGLIRPCEFDWIHGKILRCLYDKDSRNDTIESIISVFFFSSIISVKDQVKLWVRIFSLFDEDEVKALEKILEQKQRLQHEMQKYLVLRKMYPGGGDPDVHKRVLFCFRNLSDSFSEPSLAEENFRILDQLKDATNIWAILHDLLDPNTSVRNIYCCQDKLLDILGEKHPLCGFLSNLAVKCSYFPFNKECARGLFLEAAAHKSAGNAQLTQSSMDLLVILSRFSPILFVGSEEILIDLLKDDNEMIREGALHILALAGGTIREQLAVLSSSVDLMLERFCLGGCRRQAKYAVNAAAAITMDDGLKSLSVLYKRLMDMLVLKQHLPVVLQSLGCIAEIAMPVFETRESEIEDFIRNEILGLNGNAEESNSVNWGDRSDICFLKICGIKTLVKSYLPVKDVQVRHGIHSLVGILKHIFLYGEISKDVKSSSIDKAHLKLACAKAVLRLSKHWDHMMPIEMFHLTLRMAEAAIPQSRGLFLRKIYKRIKGRVLHPKYACAFLFSTTRPDTLDFDWEKKLLAEVIWMHYRAKERHFSVESDDDLSTSHPEAILPHLVHALAHHSCPNVGESKDVDAFYPLYRQLKLILSMLLHEEGGAASETTANEEKKRRHAAIASIFHSIKCSEDAVDSSKSKNSHAISELALSITKHLVGKVDLQISPCLFPLPRTLYRQIEKKQGDDIVASKRTSWLGDESVLACLESINAISDSVVKEDLEKKVETETSGRNETRQIQDENVLPESRVEGAEGDVDILKMVREMNLDSMEMELSNGPESHDGSACFSFGAIERKSHQSPSPNCRISASKHFDKNSKLNWNKGRDEARAKEYSMMAVFTKKRRKTSISGFAKCTKISNCLAPEELVGCKIKVWWPLDKQFYKGTIKSYNSSKEKHEVLYDDGDIEMLLLEKERWELLHENKFMRHQKSNSLRSLISIPVVQRRRTPMKRVAREARDGKSFHIRLETTRYSAELLEKIVHPTSRTGFLQEENGRHKSSKASLIVEEGINSDVYKNIKKHAHMHHHKATCKEPFSEVKGEISDDEPLCLWKHKYGKAAIKRLRAMQ